MRNHTNSQNIHWQDRVAKWWIALVSYNEAFWSESLSEQWKGWLTSKEVGHVDLVVLGLYIDWSGSDWLIDVDDSVFEHQ